MRSIPAVIDTVISLIPDPAPAELEDDLIVLKAELRILRRTGSYTPPEAAEDANLWQRLGVALYRYLPNPAGYAWAQSISDVVQGTSATVVSQPAS